MNKLNEEISQIRKMMGLNENKLYVSPNEIPSDIITWARGKVGSNFSKNIVINQQSNVEVSMPWHEADREYWQFFKLIDPKTAKMVGNEIGRSGLEGDGVVTGHEVSGKVTVPSGFVLACAGTYPVRLTLYTADDALKSLNDAGILDQFSIEELIILLQAKGLKSPYRTKYPDNLYMKLIEGGYLASNRSITLKGRNVAAMPETKEKIEKYADANGMYFSSSYQLSKRY